MPCLCRWIFGSGDNTKEGFARVAYIMNPEYKYLAVYREAEKLAKGSRLNIWSHSDYVTKWGFKGCVQK
ncbi:thermonuclease family protein [Neobacillus pocheonensis]|uniref:thermonuclease family protein n=1 Tax=Neobacillus pocheonensis TaxID=363869 RepID=UPI003D29B61D